MGNINRVVNLSLVFRQRLETVREMRFQGRGNNSKYIDLEVAHAGMLRSSKKASTPLLGALE